MRTFSNFNLLRGRCTLLLFLSALTSLCAPVAMYYVPLFALFFPPSSLLPLSLPPPSSQEKLLFEPYAMQKNAVYLVFTPSSSPSLTPTLRRYFRDLSIVFKVGGVQCMFRNVLGGV